MNQYSELGKDEMIFSSEPFHKIIPVYLVIRILVFYLFEQAVYFYSKKYSKTYDKLSDEDKKLWTSKATSIFHAVLVTILCIPKTITDVTHRHSDKELAFGITKRRVDVMIWTTSYLLYDLYMMIKISKKKVAPEMILHHIVCVLAYVIGIYIDIGTVFMAAFIINEFTTPFLHNRWYFSRMNLWDSQIAKINNIVFAISYVIIRGFYNIYIFYSVIAGFYRYNDELKKSTIPYGVILFLPILALSHCILNWYWIYQIYVQVVVKPTVKIENEYQQQLNKKVEEEEKEEEEIESNIVNEITPLINYEKNEDIIDKV